MKITRTNFFKMLGGALFAPFVARVAGAKKQPPNEGYRISREAPGAFYVSKKHAVEVRAVPHLPMFWEGDTLWSGTEEKRGIKLADIALEDGRYRVWYLHVGLIENEWIDCEEFDSIDRARVASVFYATNWKRRHSGMPILYSNLADLHWDCTYGQHAGLAWDGLS